MVEYALILALVALIVIVALIATGGQLINKRGSQGKEWSSTPSSSPWSP